jgi:hypothetical protein
LAIDGQSHRLAPMAYLAESRRRFWAFLTSYGGALIVLWDQFPKAQQESW